MALRIGGGLPQMDAVSQPAMLPPAGGPPPMPEMPPDPALAGPMEDPSADLGKVSQEAARYFGPEYRCGGCTHFIEGVGGQAECEIVAGAIDPDGVCSLFEPDVDGMDAAMPEEDFSEPAGLDDPMMQEGLPPEGMM